MLPAVFIADIQGPVSLLGEVVSRLVRKAMTGFSARSIFQLSILHLGIVMGSKPDKSKLI